MPTTKYRITKVTTKYNKVTRTTTKQATHECLRVKRSAKWWDEKVVPWMWWLQKWCQRRKKYPCMKDRTSDMSLDIWCSTVKISFYPRWRDCISSCISCRDYSSGSRVSSDLDFISCEASVSCSPMP